MQQRAAFVGLEVDGDAALVAIEGAEEAGGKADQPAGRIAVAAGSTLITSAPRSAEDQPGARAHDGMGEFEHADAGERRSRYQAALSLPETPRGAGLHH